MKTIYIPYMSDHAHVIVGAMHHHGLAAEVMPPPDETSLEIGLDLCRGRECLPCFMATGDVIRACRTPGFDAANAAFLMPGSPGPCRFGQYRVLQRSLLDRAGHTEAQILSPTSENSYEGFGPRPKALRLLVWQGIVAADLLNQLRLEFRPYETVPGVTDAAYQRGIERLTAAMTDGGGRLVDDALQAIAAEFSALPVEREPRRPVIALLGEIYVMLNAHTNQELARQLEAAGAEVLTGTLGEWLHFADETKLDRDRLFGSWFGFLGTSLQSRWQIGREHRYRRHLDGLLRQPPESSMRELLNMVRPYYDPLLGTEATLTLAKVVDLARQGISGVVNVMPFSCMPGLVVSGIAARVRQDYAQLPWLDVTFDGQRITNIRTRLEAFVHQVGQFAASHPARHDGAISAAAEGDYVALRRV